MSREQLQRLALVTIVVLLAMLASDRLLQAAAAPWQHHRIEHVHVHAFSADEARRMGEEARRMGEEARRHAEAMRRQAEEMHRRYGDHCEIERERVVEVF